MESQNPPSPRTNLAQSYVKNETATSDSSSLALKRETTWSMTVSGVPAQEQDEIITLFTILLAIKIKMMLLKEDMKIFNDNRSEQIENASEGTWGEERELFVSSKYLAVRSPSKFIN